MHQLKLNEVKKILKAGSIRSNCSLCLLSTDHNKRFNSSKQVLQQHWFQFTTNKRCIHERMEKLVKSNRQVNAGKLHGHQVSALKWNWKLLPLLCRVKEQLQQLSKWRDQGILLLLHSLPYFLGWMIPHSQHFRAGYIRWIGSNCN